MIRENTKHDPICEEPEPDYTPQQVAKMHQVSVDTATRWFRRVPGVLVIGNGERLHKRSKTTMRIPRSVYQRWKEEHTNVSGR
jgi:hypothetical protein